MAEKALAGLTTAAFRMEACPRTGARLGAWGLGLGVPLLRSGSPFPIMSGVSGSTSDPNVGDEGKASLVIELLNPLLPPKRPESVRKDRVSFRAGSFGWMPNSEHACSAELI